MKKLLVFTIVIAFFAISTASAKSNNFILQGYVAEKISFVTTLNGYYVNSNTDNATYDFYDLDSNSTDAYNAKLFSVVAL